MRASGGGGGGDDDDDDDAGGTGSGREDVDAPAEEMRGGTDGPADSSRDVDVPAAGGARETGDVEGGRANAAAPASEGGADAAPADGRAEEDVSRELHAPAGNEKAASAAAVSISISTRSGGGRSGNRSSSTADSAEGTRAAAQPPSTAATQEKAEGREGREKSAATDLPPKPLMSQVGAMSKPTDVRCSLSVSLPTVQHSVARCPAYLSASLSEIKEAFRTNLGLTARAIPGKRSCRTDLRTLR